MENVRLPGTAAFRKTGHGLPVCDAGNISTVGHLMRLRNWVLLLARSSRHSILSPNVLSLDRLERTTARSQRCTRPYTYTHTHTHTHTSPVQLARCTVNHKGAAGCDVSLHATFSLFISTMQFLVSNSITNTTAQFKASPSPPYLPSHLLGRGYPISARPAAPRAS